MRLLLKPRNGSDSMESGLPIYFFFFAKPPTVSLRSHLQSFSTPISMMCFFVPKCWGLVHFGFSIDSLCHLQAMALKMCSYPHLNFVLIAWNYGQFWGFLVYFAQVFLDQFPTLHKHNSVFLLRFLSGVMVPTIIFSLADHSFHFSLLGPS